MVKKPILGEYVAQLKPCPFCGSAAVIADDVRDIPDSPFYAARLVCTGCDIGMEGNWFTVPYPCTDNERASFEIKAKHALAVRWNTRVG